MKYILFDVAGTLLHKPSLYDKLFYLINTFDVKIDKQKIITRHKTLSEVIKFPDRTDKEFYDYFNTELLISLGIPPNQHKLDVIFKSCSYLPWEKFKDTEILKELKLPLGIISNFNTTLEDKLNSFFGAIFSDIFVSEKEKISKPDSKFYQNALNTLNLNPKDILYIGDSYKLDFIPATNLGINAYIIDREQYYPKQDKIIKSLTDIKNILN